MTRIQEKFNQLKSKNEAALISYIMAGYPSEKATLAAVRGLIKGGTDIIELGFPFSDPIADGPTIQMASTESLNKGTKIDDFFSIVKKIRKEADIPLVLMTYTNILYNQTYQKFISRAKEVGIDGLILPDMAIEESKEYVKAARKSSMDTIFLVSPNTSANGKIPVGVGFGISTDKDVHKYVSSGADAVIVGSANIKIMENTPVNKIESKIFTFTKKLKNKTR